MVTAKTVGVAAVSALGIGAKALIDGSYSPLWTSLAKETDFGAKYSGDTKIEGRSIKSI